MTYTAMSEAELEMEELYLLEDINSFEPIEDETIRPVSGLGSGIAAAEAGALVGAVGGPGGILLGLIGGAIGYAGAGLIVEADDNIDPTYKRFCGVGMSGEPLK